MNFFFSPWQTASKVKLGRVWLCAARRRSQGVMGGGKKQAASHKHVSPLHFLGLELGVHASLVNACGSFIYSACVLSPSCGSCIYLPFPFLLSWCSSSGLDPCCLQLSGSLPPISPPSPTLHLSSVKFILYPSSFSKTNIWPWYFFNPQTSSDFLLPAKKK